MVIVPPGDFSQPLALVLIHRPDDAERVAQGAKAVYPEHLGDRHHRHGVDGRFHLASMSSTWRVRLKPRGASSGWPCSG